MLVNNVMADCHSRAKVSFPNEWSVNPSQRSSLKSPPYTFAICSAAQEQFTLWWIQILFIDSLIHPFLFHLLIHLPFHSFTPLLICHSFIHSYIHLFRSLASLPHLLLSQPLCFWVRELVWNWGDVHFGWWMWLGLTQMLGRGGCLARVQSPWLAVSLILNHSPQS